MTRRTFLSGVCAVAGVRGTPAPLPNGGVRFCAFADLHRFTGYWPNDNQAFQDRIIARAKASGCDFIIHLGDFVHDVVLDREAVERYNNCGLPAYHVIGNHDGERNGMEACLAAYGLARSHYSFDCKGFRFIIGDCNYYEVDGKAIHYNRYEQYKVKNKTRDVFFPAEQVAWIREQVETSPYPCVFFSHMSVEREIHSVKNYLEIREIFNAANRAHPGRVRLVINGHYHAEYLRLIDNILYYDMNGASYQYYNKTHDLYPKDYIATHRNSTHAIAWNDPLSSIITLTPDGGIRLEGSKSTFFRGITPEIAGYPLRDGDGRVTRPEMQTLDIHLGGWPIGG